MLSYISNTDFMSWLWKEDRQTYTLIMFGHIELITQDIIDKYTAEGGKA